MWSGFYHEIYHIANRFCSTLSFLLHQKPLISAALSILLTFHSLLFLPKVLHFPVFKTERPARAVGGEFDSHTLPPLAKTLINKGKIERLLPSGRVVPDRTGAQMVTKR